MTGGTILGELELALRQRISRYVRGELPLREFYRWFSAETWNIEARSDYETAQLYHTVDLLLAEHAQGDWTENELKERLSAFSTHAAVAASPAAPIFQGMPSNVGRPLAPTQYFYSLSFAPGPSVQESKEILVFGKSELEHAA